jgi:outer membrane protein OmpA-like peptidoglycan-associated protein
MANLLFELEKSLRSTKKRRVRRAARPRTPTGKPPASAPRVGTAAPAIPAGASRAAAAVDYRVPGIVAPVRQPSSMTCWATVTTIMKCWRAQASMTIETAIGQIGANWLAKFTANQGLTTAEKAPFLAAAGLAYEYPQSLTAAGWEGLLRRYGPLWVTTDEDPTAGFAIHARVMAGIHGDGTDAGTKIDVIDPATGTAYEENLGKFRSKYEAEARETKGALRIQIVHWPHDVGFAVARALMMDAAAYSLSLGAGGFTTVDDAEFEPGYDEANPDRPVTRAASTFAFMLTKPKKMTAADARWAADADSPDYRHLRVPIDTTPFVLKGSVIRRLVELNHFSLEGVDAKVVFGLRGCTIDANLTAFADSASVKEVVPNHIDNRCVIGVWDTATDKIVAFQASTVPNWEYMETYRQDRAKPANMLPTGRYAMVVGTHRPKKKNAKGELVDNPGRVQGALRNDATVVVLRTEDDLTYTTKDVWDETVANDNIHPGIIPVNAGTSTVPDFSSAGCHTVPGGSVGDAPSGAWADFRTALGFDNTKPTRHDGKKLAYVLLTGREARCVASGAVANFPARLRFGSRGDKVKALQEALARHAKKYYTAKTADGEFGPGTAMAFIRFQKDRDSGAADGIVTPTDATALGFTLPVPPPSATKQQDIPGKVVDFLRGIFKKAVRRPEEGRFKVESDNAELLHDDTPAIAPWKRTSVNFTLKATTPNVTLKDVARGDISGGNTFLFKFRLEFEHNGYDIREAQVHREIQNSSPLYDGRFEVKFTAKKATTPRSEVARIDFIVTGKWDPGLGNKFFDFSGKLYAESDGDFGLDLDPNDRVKIEYFAGGTFSNMKVTPLPAPRVVKTWHAVFFAPPGSDRVTDDELQRLKDWLRELKKDDIRYRRLREGAIKVTVEGYASATGRGQLNQELSGRRADRIIKLLRDELGSSAKIDRAAHGEDHPADKHEKEDPAARRVDVWFEVAM